MAIRLPLPNRLQLQTLVGLRSAIVGGANTVSNNVITTDSVLGFINAFEDDFLSPLRLIWMRTTDNEIQLDQYGRFDVRTSLSKTLLEIVSLWSSAAPAGSVSGAYYQYEVPYDRKDLNTFRKLQGNVNVEPIYTVDGPLVKVWPPANYYGPLNCSYYADWPRLGDVSSTSLLQEYTLSLAGVATATGNLTIQTASLGTTTIPIAIGDTPSVVLNKLLSANVIYSLDAGGNELYWQISLLNSSAVFTSPSYVANNVALNVNLTATGLTFGLVLSQSALLDTVQKNWFLDNFPYIYYYGALKHVFFYLNDMERAKSSHDQAMKYVNEIQAISDRADVSDSSDSFNFNQNVQW